MDEFIQELRAHSEKTLIPLNLPTEEELIEVEEQIFLPLPKSYREFLLSASDLILGKLEPATAADPNAHTYIPEMAATAWDNGLPRDVFPICEHLGGYFTMNPEGGVQLWADGDYTANKDWEDIWEWANNVWLKSAINL